MTERPETVVYFVPHQDDDVLTFGISRAHDLARGLDVHVVLCTDGSQCPSRLVLGDGETECVRIRQGKRRWGHPGAHVHDLTEEEFVDARDTEFLLSNLAAGVRPGNVHIDFLRAVDGSLSVEDAVGIMRRFLDRFPGAQVRTCSPISAAHQHRDHKALGVAAENLFEEGSITDLRLFVEPYLHRYFSADHPDIELREDVLDPSMADTFMASLNEYRTWNPGKKRFAAGWHSAWQVFPEDILVHTGRSYAYSSAVRSTSRAARVENDA